MITLRLNIIVMVCFTILVGANSLHASVPGLKEVEMGPYRIISTAPEKTIMSWLDEFESTRLVVKQLTGITDEQVLPLTVILFEEDREFYELVPYDGTRSLVFSVGMKQQPLMAISLSGVGYDPNQELKIRSALILWMLGSSGIEYDPWVVQGMIDLIGATKISSRRITLGMGIPYYRNLIASTREHTSGRQFMVENGLPSPGYAWGALHYFTLRNRRWEGMGKINRYQQLVASGTPREMAFKTSFGMTSGKADVLIQEYLAKDRFKAVKIPRQEQVELGHLQVKRPERGRWELSQASLLVQQMGLDHNRITRLLDAAGEMMPDNPEVYELLWLYKAKMHEDGAAYENLLKARELGSKNHAIRLQWSIDLINRGIIDTQGFIIAAENAAEAANDLIQMDTMIPGRLLVYRLHAQLLASIIEPRDRDREFLENAMEKFHATDPVLALGLASWYWRAGRMDQARLHLAQSNYEVNDVKFIRFFGDWVRTQIETQQSLDEIEDFWNQDDYETMKELYGYLPRTYVLIPDLEKRSQAIDRELKHYDLLMTIRARLDAGEKSSARILIQSMDELEMSGKLEAMGEELRQRL